MAWKGFAGDVLRAIRDVIDAKKALITAPDAAAPGGAQTLKFVRVGEQARGWDNPAAFLSLAGRVTVAKESGRTGVKLYTVPVQVAILVKNFTDSKDDVAIALAEACMDVLDASPGIAGTILHEFVDIEVIQAIPNDGGGYLTVGVLRVDYLKEHDDANDARP